LRWVALAFLWGVVLAASPAPAQTDTAAPQPAKPRASQSPMWSEDDGWLDVSGFLKEKYGFLPILVPITEPAVGYGGALGLLFLSRPIGQAVEDGLGRPSITAVGGLGTQNGSWGAFAGDSRYWLDDHLQTQFTAFYMSINLDFHGIGKDALLGNHPLDYNVAPAGAFGQAKYRFGDTRLWAGLGYVYSATRVHFDAPEGTPGRPSFENETNVGGVTPSLTWDTRDNIFTPTRGTYLEASAGVFVRALGADDNFQRAKLVALEYVPLGQTLFLGLRAEGAASFADTPFYLRPFIVLRGAPAVRYQGDEVAEIEAELRWQFWRRFSLVGFVGCGAAWNDLQHFDNSQTVLTGGGGFRYEIAREYGIHLGLDVGFGPHSTALYVQVGSAWARP